MSSLFHLKTNGKRGQLTDGLLEAPEFMLIYKRERSRSMVLNTEEKLFGAYDQMSYDLAESWIIKSH
jgi:hypothetical protein